MRLILRFILVVFILIIVGVTALLFMPGDRIAKFAEDQFEAATGRQMDITGDVRTSIYPLLGVRTGPVTIANADWAGGEPMLRAEGLSIGVNLMALFKGDVKIKKVEVISPVILLEVAKDGRANWDMAPAGAATAPAGASTGGGTIPAFTLGRGLVRAGKLTYINHASGEKTVLSDLDIDLRLPDFAGRGDISMSARMHGQAIALDTTVANFGKLLNGGVSMLEASVKTGGSSIAFEGKAGISPFEVDGKVDADLADMAALFGVMGMEAPDLPKGMGRTAKLSGNVIYTAQGTAHLRNGTIRLDQNVLTGAVDVFIAGKERPFVKGQFEADALDFSVLAASVDNETGAAVETAAGWSKDVIDVSALSSVDADVGLAANSIDLGTVKLGPSSVAVKLDRSRAVFALHKVQAYQGVVSGQFVMNGRGGLSVGGDLKVAHMAMQPLLIDLADYERLIAVGDLRLKFLGVGNTVNAIMHSLSGDGSFTLGQGEILGLDLGGMLRNLDTSFRGEGQKTVFNSIGATFTMKGGVLYNDDLAFVAPLARADGSGEVGVGEQTLNYRINPVALAAADGSGGISVPVLITGTWANPKFRPDLKGLIDQNLAEEKAALEAKIAAEKAAIKARLQAEKAALQERLDAKRAAAEQRAKDALGVETQEGESVEDAARRKLEEEAKRGLLNLLGNN